MVQAAVAGKNDREYWAQLMPDAVDGHDQMVSPAAIRMLSYLQVHCGLCLEMALLYLSVPCVDRKQQQSAICHML